MIRQVDAVDFVLMDATAPSKPPVTLAAPINVEESRAQRLQRQQARFRDRGGQVILV